MSLQELLLKSISYLRKQPVLRKIARFLFRKKIVIPEYSEKRAIILSYKKLYKTNVFVETGTFMGDTIEALVDDFDRLHSIELSEELALRATKRFADKEKVTIVQGNSDIELRKILATLDEPTLFWLDGHYSGEFMYEDEYIKTAKGALVTPIIRELEDIFSFQLPHIILIDDARLFNGREDYPTISQIKQLVKSASKIKRKLTVKRDIIRIVPVH